MFSKEIKSLKDIIGLQAGTITDDQLSAVSADFEKFKITGIEVARAGTSKAHSDKVTDLEAQVSTLEAKVTELGGKPAEDHTKPEQAKSDKIESETLTPQQVIDALPHNQEADEL